jgi:hypothetical protein
LVFHDLQVQRRFRSSAYPRNGTVFELEGHEKPS